MVDAQEDNQGAPGADPPEVKPKHAGGRKPKGYYERGVQDKLDGSAPVAVEILNKHINQRKGYKKTKDSVLRTCYYIIDHAIGKARQKIEHSGGVLTYSELIKSIDKPREILADSEELSAKTPSKN